MRNFLLLCSLFLNGYGVDQHQIIDALKRSAMCNYSFYDFYLSTDRAILGPTEWIQTTDAFLTNAKKRESSNRDLELEYRMNPIMAETEIQYQKKIKNVFIVGGSGLILVSFIGFILYYKRRQLKDRKHEAEFKVRALEMELKVLRAQMNSHFIFNTLNSINDFMLRNNAGLASIYLTKFATLMRLILENSCQMEILLEKDLKILDLYLQIESMRLKHKFTYAIHITEAVDIENTLIPPLILQPYVENSIWHGMSSKHTMGHIQIIFSIDEGMLNCVVDDNGIGRNCDSLKHQNGSGSLGTNLTERRIEIINKRKNTKGTVTFIDKREGLCVEVKLPLQLAF